jgi:hypothetical protein
MAEPRPTNLISKDHEAPISLPPQCTTDALGRVSNRVKAQEFGLAYPVSIAQVLQARFQYSAFCVLVRNANMNNEREREPLCDLGNLPKHDNRTTIVVVKIYPFGYLPSCNG